MSLFSLKLNAADLGEMLGLVKKARDNPEDLSYKLIRQEIIKNDPSCTHCPKHLLLTEQINRVLAKYQSDNVEKSGDELPVKLNDLKFLYYTVTLEQKMEKKFAINIGLYRNNLIP